MGKEMVLAADADGTGDIDFLEFAVLMAHKMTDENKDDTLKKAFAVFDASGDGFISAQEMRKIMFNLGENLQQVDVDGDGQINYQEFAKILSSDGDAPSVDEKPSPPGKPLSRRPSKESMLAKPISRRPSKESMLVAGSRDRVGISIEGDRSRTSSKEGMQVVNHP